MRGLCYMELVCFNLFFSVTRPANRKVTYRTPTVAHLYVSLFAIHVSLICLCKGVNNFSITPNNLTSFFKNNFSLTLTGLKIFGYASGLI